MTLSKEERQKIREMLPHGALSDIAKKLMISRMAVSKYFMGRSNSYRIEKEAVEMYMVYKKEFDKIKSTING